MTIGQRPGHVGPHQRLDLQEIFNLRRQRRQHRFQVNGEDPERFQQAAADFMQRCFLAWILGQFPRLVGVDVGVDEVGLLHHCAQGFAIFAAVV